MIPTLLPMSYPSFSSACDISNPMSNMSTTIAVSILHSEKKKVSLF